MKQNVGNQKGKDNIESLPYQKAVKRLFAVHGPEIGKTGLEAYADKGQVKPESAVRLDNLA